LGGRFEPDIRESGLLAVGAGRISVTASGMEQYDLVARNVAAQVVSDKQRSVLVPCRPVAKDKPDNRCAREFLSRAGRLLYRRALTPGELTTYVAKAKQGAEELNDFYAGLELSLAGILVSPPFLFVQEHTRPDRTTGERTLDGYSRASRLSFFLWNTIPDEELLNAAEKGDLFSQKKLLLQVDRMIASPKLENGVRAFFGDLLELDKFKTLSKDSAIYPKYTFQVSDDAREQTLRTIVDHLLTKGRSYPDLFKTRDTYLTQVLASLYRVPMPSSEGWVPYTFSANDGQYGILTHLSFLSLHSHPGRTSPTLRGKALREILLCQRVPDPPGNVDFNVVQDTANPNFKTVRQRLNAHATEAMCKGCHKITDPMGLALENFDTVGGFRRTENGADIDTSGELDGRQFSGAAGLGDTVAQHPALTTCLLNRIYSYGVGRAANKSELGWLNAELQPQFLRQGARFPDLLRNLVSREEFYRVASEKEQQAAVN
jgi:hypothetical protein